MDMQPNRNMAVENQLQAVQLGASLYDRAQTQKRMMEQFQLQSAEFLIQKQGMELQNKIRENALATTIKEQKAEVDEFDDFSKFIGETGAYLDNPTASAKFPVMPAFKAPRYRLEANKMLDNFEKYSARAELLKTKEKARNESIASQTAILREAMQMPGAVEINPETQEPIINWKVFNTKRQELFDADKNRKLVQTDAIKITLDQKQQNLNRLMREGGDKNKVALAKLDLNKDNNELNWAKLDAEIKNNIARLGFNYDQLDEISRKNLADQEIKWEQLNQNDVISLRKQAGIQENRTLKENQFNRTLEFKQRQQDDNFDLRMLALNKKAAAGEDILPDVMSNYELNFGKPTEKGAANIAALVRSKNWKPLSTSESKTFQSDALVANKAAKLLQDFRAFEKANPNFIDKNQGFANTTFTDIKGLILKETDPKKQQYLKLFQRFNDEFNTKALVDSGKSVTSKENERLKLAIADRKSKNFINSFEAFAEITAQTFHDKLKGYKYSHPIDPYYVELADKFNEYYDFSYVPFQPSAQSIEPQGAGGSFEKATPSASGQGTNAAALPTGWSIEQ